MKEAAYARGGILDLMNFFCAVGMGKKGESFAENFYNPTSVNCGRPLVLVPDNTNGTVSVTI